MKFSTTYTMDKELFKIYVEILKMFGLPEEEANKALEDIISNEVTATVGFEVKADLSDMLALAPGLALLKDIGGKVTDIFHLINNNEDTIKKSVDIISRCVRTSHTVTGIRPNSTVYDVNPE